MRSRSSFAPRPGGFSGAIRSVTTAGRRSRTSGRLASSTDSATWTTFDEALAAYRRGGFDGIGFVFGDGWCGFDSDGSRDSQTGAIDAATLAMLHRLTHADPYTHDMIIGMPDTGLRADSLRKLTSDDVQETHVVVPPHKQKWGLKKKVQTTMRIPIISERLREVLERRRLGPDGQPLPLNAHVFGTPTGEKMRREFWGDLFRATRERAGITSKGRNRLNAHDFRGEFGSQLSDLGIPMKDISMALGHSTSAATEAYLRPRVAHLDDAHERLQAQRAGKVLPFQNFTNRFTRKTRKSKKTA